MSVRKFEEKQGDTDLQSPGEADIPAALKRIDKSGKNHSSLHTRDGLEMYIVIGEGPPQKGGGNVASEELYETDNSIVIRTRLTGTRAVVKARGQENSYRC